MIRRETGGKVRCEQALFVFGVKTDQSSGDHDGHPERYRQSGSDRGIPRRDEQVIHAGQKTVLPLSTPKNAKIEQSAAT
jgi:hypothetical protein